MPTSLLAQVDSSVGGKTGIDTRQGRITLYLTGAGNFQTLGVTVGGVAAPVLLRRCRPDSPEWSR